MSLAEMLRPRSVAVVGASPNAGKAGHALLRSLAGFPGRVHPVHPRAGEVLGRQAYPTVAAIPDVVDLALLAVPATAVRAAVADCAAAGVAGVVVHAGGFAETGPEGLRLQQEAHAAARAADMRMVGPNTSGFVAPPAHLCASFVASTLALRPGPLAIVAQSGGVNHALAFAAHADGLGLRLGIGLGNAADVGFADVLEHLAGDPETGVVALAIEGIADGRGLVAAVERLVDSVPVVALTLGRGDVGDFARSHTGALSGSRAITRAALRQAGAVVVDDVTEVVDAARALSGRRLRPTADAGVGVVTGQAGPGLLLTDALAVEGVRTPPLSEPGRRRVAELTGGMTYARNPVDTGRPGPTFPEVLATVAGEDSIDLLAVYALDEPDAIALPEALSGVEDMPLVVGTAGPGAAVDLVRDRLADRGMPVMATPERAAKAVAALVRDARAAARRAGGVLEAPQLAPAAVAMVRAVGAWDEARAKELIELLGIEAPAGVVCGSHDEVHAAAAALDCALAVKLVHPHLEHKTERGAVVLGVDGGASLGTALAQLDAVSLPPPRRYLVEAMAPDGPDLLLGSVRDPAFGPIVTLGVGGVTAELAADVTSRLAPVTVSEAATMLDDLEARSLFRGFRGAPAVDEARLASAIAHVAAVLPVAPDLQEIEINPLRVTRGGLLALDALVVPCPPTREETGVDAR